MEKLDGGWAFFAHPMTLLVIGVLFLIAFFYLKRKAPEILESNSIVLRVFSNSMAAYFFGICVLAHYGSSNPPSLSDIISLGFGNDRSAQVFGAYIAISLFEIVKIFIRPLSANNS